MARISTPNAVRIVQQMDTEKLIGLIGTDDAQIIEQIRPAVCWSIEAASPTYLPNTERPGAWNYIAEVAASRVRLDSHEVPADDFNIAGDEETAAPTPSFDVRAAVEAIIAEVQKEGGN